MDSDSDYDEKKKKKKAPPKKKAAEVMLARSQPCAAAISSLDAALLVAATLPCWIAPPAAPSAACRPANALPSAHLPRVR